MKEKSCCSSYLFFIIGLIATLAFSCVTEDDENLHVGFGLVTSPATNVTQKTAQCGGKILGGDPPTGTTYGVCWSTSMDPTISDLRNIESPLDGTFSSFLNYLTPNTTYYVRAYATDNSATTYGNTISFTTPDWATPAIGAGAAESLALTRDGIIWLWGYNYYAHNYLELFDGVEPPDDFRYPTQIGAGFAAIAEGYHHFLALKPDGELWAGGWSGNGQVGDGYGYFLPHPLTRIGDGYASISAGATHSLALKTDGSLWAWGSNDRGELGNGSNLSEAKPLFIGNGYSKVSAGVFSSLAIKLDGTLWAWGDNSLGSLGDGTLVNKSVPVLIGSGYKMISAGAGFSLAIKTDGTLWAWGINDHGQLGDGTLENKTRPVLVGSGYIQISAGNAHSMALKNDGTLWTWGFNLHGQLGDGTTVDKKIPVMIGSGYANIDAGFYHSIALKTDGTFCTWGSNEYGELGLGFEGEKHEPRPMSLQ